MKGIDPDGIAIEIERDFIERGVGDNEELERAILQHTNSPVLTLNKQHFLVSELIRLRESPRDDDLEMARIVIRALLVIGRCLSMKNWGCWWADGKETSRTFLDQTEWLLLLYATRSEDLSDPTDTSVG